MKKINFATLILTILCGISVNAGATGVMQIGTPSCGNWVKEGINNSAMGGAYFYWLSGYLSGMAVATNKDILRDADTASIVLWMDNYCKENPLRHVDYAANELFTELKRSKGIK